jgi:hypothetical protein
MLISMDTTTRILKIEMDSDDGFIVTFSDKTTAGYVVEELLELRPARECYKNLGRRTRTLPSPISAIQ